MLCCEAIMLCVRVSRFWRFRIITSFTFKGDIREQEIWWVAQYFFTCLSVFSLFFMRVF